MEQTLVLLKPDALDRGLVGKIISRFEEKGLKICGLKMMHLTSEEAEAHYQEHRGKPFFPELITYFTSGPLVAMVLEGQDVVRVVRQLMGDTPGKIPGTIRGDWATSITTNLIHGSDSRESVAREMAFFFRSEEVFS